MTIAGKFITIEGGEGTGKSTLIAGLKTELSAHGMKVLTTREPGGTLLAEEVRELALKNRVDGQFSPLAMALLMHTARDDLLERQIRPALRAGYWVICDRFADSTRVYQGIDGVSETMLDALEKGVVADTIPDLTLILDGAPEDLLKRRASRGVDDVFEARDGDFHQEVRQRFLTIARDNPQRCVVIDALSEASDVLDAGLSMIKRRVGLP
ncbi:MAG: dTMP kinase [Pseudomonadota bacterium]